MTRPFKSSDKIPYDPWFDDKVEPSTLLKPTRKEKLITIHEVMYQLSRVSHNLIGGSESYM